MTTEHMDGFESRLSLEESLERMARAGGCDVLDVLGAPVAIDLKFEVSAAGIALSGVPGDLPEQFGRSRGITVSTDETGQPTLWWSAAASHGVPPAQFTSGASGYSASVPGAVPILLTPASEQERTARDEIDSLRTALASTAQLLAPAPGSVAGLDVVAATFAACAEAVAATCVDIATSRRLLGHYLVDASDRFDDERLDQLGDGYIQLAELWSLLPTDLSLLNEILVAEAQAAELMAGAATRPTRYAF